MAGDDGAAAGPAGSRWRTRLVRAAAMVAALVVVGLAVLAWNKVPNLYPEYQPPLGSPALPPEVAATRASSRDQSIVTTRASVLAALAGLGALVTIGINYRNSQTNARTLATTQETFRVTERGNLSDRYTKAIEQLGNVADHGSIAIRLGGIYALQQLAVDTRQDSDQAAVVEVLSAFVRLNLRSDPATGTPPESGDGSDDVANERVVAPRADVLAAISVLAQLPTRAGAPMRTDFTGLDFTGITLTQARLTGADLTGAILTGADLAGADLTGAILTGADLAEADLADANLTAADLTGARLTGADLINADLTGADLAGARLFDARLTGADLTGADLIDARLTEADLTRANLTGARLIDAILIGADLTEADLTRANLTGANLGKVTLSEKQLGSVRRRPDGSPGTPEPDHAAGG